MSRLSQPATLVVSEVVVPARLDDYWAWTRHINQAAHRSPGFLSVEILQPQASTCGEYLAILKFDCGANLQAWITSSTHRRWLAASQDFVLQRSCQWMASGLEPWMSANTSQPPYYKRVILGVLGVYPLIVLVEVLMGDWLQPLPPLVGLLVSVTVVSALLTYPVMPWLNRALGRWLRS